MPSGEAPIASALFALGIASWNVQNLRSKGDSLLKAVAATGASLSAADHFAGRQPYTLTIQIPHFYSADARGFRRPIEEDKFLVTHEEIKQLFPGYSRLNVSDLPPSFLPVITRETRV